MANFIFVYHGGDKPETPEEGSKAMEEWQTWFSELGDAVVDGGNPVGQSSTVMSDGAVVKNGGSNPASGYSIIRSDSMNEAIAVAKTCPIVSASGTVEVAEIIEM